MRVGATAIVSICLGVASAGVQAALIDRGGGLIYDTDLQITWLQDADLANTNDFGVAGVDPSGAMDWYAAQNWIAAMNAAQYGGFSNWRLPTVTPATPAGLDLGFAYDGSAQRGYNITDTRSELAHLFNVDLGSTALFSPAGVLRTTYGVGNTGPFLNVRTDDYYWYGTETAATEAIFFISSNGLQSTYFKAGFGMRTWAVRDGDVVSVPEPATFSLLAAGLAGIRFARRRRAVPRSG